MWQDLLLIVSNKILVCLDPHIDETLCLDLYMIVFSFFLTKCFCPFTFSRVSHILFDGEILVLSLSFLAFDRVKPKQKKTKQWSIQ